MADLKNLADLLMAAREISNRNDFNEYTNTRSFEKAVKALASRTYLDQALKEGVEDYIKQNNESDRAVCFVLFFTVFTIFRKNKIANVYEYMNSHKDAFGDYEFFRFIEILAEYNAFKDDKSKYKIIKKAKALTDKKIFSSHNGVINLYVEAVCEYFESNLEEREDNKVYLDDAKGKINTLISGEEGDYAKFYLNLGRIEALLSNYNLAENYIREAIGMIEAGEMHIYEVNEYEQYLMKVNMIKLYDKNDEKIKEVERIKTDNLKSMSIITALLAFILGAINVFSEVKDPQTLVKLMVGYFGLVVVLLGVLLLGIRVIYKEKKNRFLAYSWLVLLLGVAIFITAIVLIW